MRLQLTHQQRWRLGFLLTRVVLTQVFHGFLVILAFYGVMFLLCRMLGIVEGQMKGPQLAAFFLVISVTMFAACLAASGWRLAARERVRLWGTSALFLVGIVLTLDASSTYG